MKKVPTRLLMLVLCLMGSVAFTWYVVILYPKGVPPLPPPYPQQDSGNELGSSCVAVSNLLDLKGPYMAMVNISNQRLSGIKNDLRSRGIETVQIRLFYREAFHAASLTECVERYCDLTGRHLEGNTPHVCGFSMTMVDIEGLNATEQALRIQWLLEQAGVTLAPVGEHAIRVQLEAEFWEHVSCDEDSTSNSVVPVKK